MLTYLKVSDYTNPPTTKMEFALSKKVGRPIDGCTLSRRRVGRPIDGCTLSRKDKGRHIDGCTLSKDKGRDIDGCTVSYM